MATSPTTYAAHTPDIECAKAAAELIQRHYNPGAFGPFKPYVPDN